MALPQPAEIASTNSDGARGDAVRGSLGRYLKDLEGQPLAVRTREAYAAHVSAYAAWLADARGLRRRCASRGRAIMRRGTSSGI